MDTIALLVFGLTLLFLIVPPSLVFFFFFFVSSYVCFQVLVFPLADNVSNFLMLFMQERAF